ncbi:hypothetical protein OF83DRAFT_1178086 [Amylostereum chailletii]|nr:hypothetical protein OF83DRAFT_1178086 [Amylostereum chailletii]
MSISEDVVHTPTSTSSLDAEAPFNSSLPGADVILRSSNNVHFHAHKNLLAIASPILRDMFISPTPPFSVKSNDANHSAIQAVPFPGDAHTLALFLRMIYPVDTPDLIALEDIHALLEISRKFDVRAVRVSGHLSLLKALPKNNPMSVYALAMTYGLHEVASQAALPCLRLPLSALNTPEIRLLSGDQYHRLLDFYIASWKTISVVTTRVVDWLQPVKHYIVLGRIHCACWRADSTRTFWARRDVWAYLTRVRYACQHLGMDALKIELDEEVKYCHQCSYCTGEEKQWEEFLALFRVQVEKQLAKVPLPNFE